MTEQIEEFGPFEPVGSVLQALESIPGLNDNLHERALASRRMEHEYQAGLAAVRHLAGLTQADVAEKMGIRQGGVSRLERRSDTLVSTLKAYFDAVGAEATITIRVGNVEQQIALDELVGLPAAT